MNTNYDILNSTPARTYSKVCTFAGTALFGWLGKKAAQKLGCEKRGQAIGAVTGVVAYSALLAKGEKMWDESLAAQIDAVWDEEENA